MPLIPNEEVRDIVRTAVLARTPYRVIENQKRENSASLKRLSHDGSVSGFTERRILLYETRRNDKVYMQYPGIESTREGDRNFPLDARPVLQKANGSCAADMDLMKTWYIIGRNHCADTDILAVLFLKNAYMMDHHHNEAEYLCETIDISTWNILSSANVPFVWNSFEVDIDVLDTLNDRFGLLEGILYYNDLLTQNLGCKCSYLNVDRWNVKTGRINNCLSHLTVISHNRGHIGISKLIDSFQRTGVAPLPQNRLWEACSDLVQYEQ